MSSTPAGSGPAAVAALPDNCTVEMIEAMRYYAPAHVLWGGVGFNEGHAFFFGGEPEGRNYLGGLLSEAMPAHSIK